MTRIVLSFDDGRKDNIEVAIPILKKYELKATFNIATGYVDGTIPKNLIPCANPPMSIPDVIKLHSEGHEIASHGNNHMNTVEDIKIGLEKLRKWFEVDNNYKWGFASPRSDLSITEVMNGSDEYRKMNIQYVRIGIDESYTACKKILRKVANITKSKYLYYRVFEKCLMDSTMQGRFVINSIPVMNGATITQLDYLIKKAIEKNKDCVLMLHSIVNKGDAYERDTWSWSREKFEILCKSLSKMQMDGKIEVCTNIEMKNYY